MTTRVSPFDHHTDRLGRRWPGAIRATVRKLRKYGAEVIKFCGTGGVFSKTDTAVANNTVSER